MEGYEVVGAVQTCSPGRRADLCSWRRSAEATIGQPDPGEAAVGQHDPGAAAA
jgi:hypothetical protein